MQPMPFVFSIPMFLNLTNLTACFCVVKFFRQCDGYLLLAWSPFAFPPISGSRFKYSDVVLILNAPIESLLKWKYQPTSRCQYQYYADNFWFNAIPMQFQFNAIPIQCNSNSGSMQFQFNAIPIQCNSNSGSMQFQCNFNSMQFNAIPMQVKAIQCYSMQLTATTHRPLQTCSQTKYTGAVMQRRGRNFASSRRTDSCFKQDIAHTWAETS